MNEGIDSVGRADRPKCARFTIACAVDPTRADLALEARAGCARSWRPARIS